MARTCKILRKKSWSDLELFSRSVILFWGEQCNHDVSCLVCQTNSAFHLLVLSCIQSRTENQIQEIMPYVKFKLNKSQTKLICFKICIISITKINLTKQIWCVLDVQYFVCNERPISKCNSLHSKCFHAVGKLRKSEEWDFWCFAWGKNGVRAKKRGGDRRKRSQTNPWISKNIHLTWVCTLRFHQ